MKSLNLPSPAKKRIALRVTAAAERAIKRGHPWLFESAIISQSHAGAAGDLAVIFDKKRNFLAVGLYDPDSPIRVRIVQRLKPATVGEAFFKAKLDAANQIRQPLRDAAKLTNGYRLVHGENDGLPGLIIDRYAETYVVKLYTPAWIPHLNDVLAALNHVIASGAKQSPSPHAEIASAEKLPRNDVARVVLRLSDRLKNNNVGLKDGMVLQGEPLDGAIIFHENGLRFEADPVKGQKTGFFLDQRENRARVETLAKGKRVLNVFSYTGGFSVYAARGGATEVTSLDASKPATDAAERNFKLNFSPQSPYLASPASGGGTSSPPVKRGKLEGGKIHTTITGDAFKEMTRMKNEGQRFEMIIIDPPSFAKKAAQTDAAINAYQKLTKLGLDILAPNGILVQASCSSRVESDDFFDAIHIAAQQHRRPLNEIERTSHALDHPIGFREGEYLKCLFAIAP